MNDEKYVKQEEQPMTVPEHIVESSPAINTQFQYLEKRGISNVAKISLFYILSEDN